MFKFKRNFSEALVRNSPIKSVTPCPTNGSPIGKRARLSITPRKQLWNNSPDPKSIETTPLPPRPKSPIQAPVKGDSLLMELKRKYEDLKEQKKLQDEKIEREFNEVKRLRERIAEVDLARIEFDVLSEAATLGQVLVRDLLNEIYDSGNETANSASHLFNEAKANHEKKFDKFLFAVNQRMDSYEAALTKEHKQLSHEIEINKRILMTINCQNQNDQKCAEREKEKEREEEKEKEEDGNLMEQLSTTGPLIFEGNKEDKDREEDVCEVLSDDCIIIEQSLNKILDNEITSENSNHTTDPQEEMTDLASTEGNAVEEDEETDIEEQEKQTEEGSFTPCQAQRLN